MKPAVKFTPKIDLSYVDLEEWKAKRMYLQGYRFVGRHSAIKVCEWAKKSIRGCGHCYKEEFYGIKSSQCIQMSPAAFFCEYNCLHCWRSLAFSLPKADFKWDSPELIFKGCLDEHKKYLAGFGGSGGKINKKALDESAKPKHFAISLSGEPTIYPFLPEFIDIIKKNGMTAYLVTNGAHPEMIKKLIEKHEPTNLYVTLHGPTKEIFKKEVCPMINDGWEKLHSTLSLLKEFKCNTVIRLTLSKKTNVVHPEKYAQFIEKYQPTYVECKAFMSVGGAREKMGMDAMPFHNEMIDFAKEIEKHCSYKIMNEKKDSRVVLLKKI